MIGYLHRAMYLSFALVTAAAIQLAGCADPSEMDAPPEPPDLNDYATVPLYCSGSAMADGEPFMRAWRIEVTPGGRCHQLAMRLDLAGHFPDDSQRPVATIEETADAVGPVDVTEAQLSAGEVTLDITGISGHPGLWSGTFTRAGEAHPVSCWSSAWQPRYRYDAATGTCIDSDGEPGRNPIAVPVVRDSGIGHCADLSEHNLNEDDLSYPEWRGFDLRGADLNGAMLFFAFIYDSQLEGAQLTDLQYGYASVTGTMDSHTALPTEGGCTQDGDSIECTR